MEHEMAIKVFIDTEDGQDYFEEKIPLTEEEYLRITTNTTDFIFPRRIHEEIRTRYPGRLYNDELYELDGKCYVCA